MTCPQCDGECVIEMLTASQCERRVGDCCGGCTLDVECPTCHGTGWVNEFDEEDDQ